VGGYFDGHPWHEKVRVRVEDRTHASTRYLDGAGILRVVQESEDLAQGVDKLLTTARDAGDQSKRTPDALMMVPHFLMSA